jgi:FkbM family methyltransferase
MTTSNHISHVSHLQWVENALCRLLRDGIRTQWMVDVGAHHGTSLAPFLRAGWHVIAFEPVEENRRRLEETFRDNPRLVSRPEAVSNAAGTRELQLALNLDGSLHEYHHSLEKIGEDAWHKKGPVVSVPTVTLDGLVERGEIPEQIGFLKVDTEGHDLAVLACAGRLRCEVISVEFWGDEHPFGKSPSPADAVMRVLRRRGFEDFIAISHHLDNTTVLYSTLEGTRPDSWGNLVFFHQSRRDLYERLREDPDWLFVLEQSRQFDALNNELRAKEAVVQDLATAAAARLTALEHVATRLRQVEAASRPLLTRLKSRARGTARRLLRLLARPSDQKSEKNG